MTRQERFEMSLHADRPHAGTAAAVRNAECLVQVEASASGALFAGPGDAHLRIKVGAVEINLPAMAMHDVADLANMLLEHAVGRGIGDHDSREMFRMLR